jgi:hypothetical protein
MGFKVFSPSKGMLSAIGNTIESTQNRQKLPKCAQKQLPWETLKYHQKLGF